MTIRSKEACTLRRVLNIPLIRRDGSTAMTCPSPTPAGGGQHRRSHPRPHIQHPLSPARVDQIHYRLVDGGTPQLGSVFQIGKLPPPTLMVMAVGMTPTILIGLAVGLFGGILMGLHIVLVSLSCGYPLI